MSAALTADNLLSWLIQTSVLALAGTLLPMVLRIRHPKSQLTYYHTILLLCFALPLVQPWQHPLIFIPVSAGRGAVATSPVLSWPDLIVGIIVFGIAARLSWLGVGLWQLRRYRRSAVPLCPVPQSIREARKLTGSDALFCLSNDVTGPATLGHIDPVVLLPASFVSLDQDAQRSIVCHELLHVGRKDWLVTMLEEVAGALFWFNPAVRWLLAQAKLTREQLVDAEVVQMTSPAPYIQALLSMAVVTKGRWALPAAPFFTEGHLVHRMRSLLTNPTRSWIRLGVSYVLAASLLIGAGLGMVAWFPLVGEAQLVALRGVPAPLLIVHQIKDDNVVFAGTPGAFNFPVGVVGGLLHTPPALNPNDTVERRPEFIPPPPPPPPPGPPRGVGPFEFLTIQGVRVIRPGDKPSREELERFIQSFPERSVVEVTQAEDGTIERITVQARRLADAANSIPFGYAPHLAGQAPAGATNPEPIVGADRVD